MQMGVSFKGLEQFRDKIKKAPQFAEDAAFTAMGLCVKKIESDIVKDLNKRGDVPSAPGEAPHTVTGLLKRSMYSSVKKTGKLLVEGTIGNNAQSKGGYHYAGGDDAASGLEFGTSKMQPRPFFRPNIDKNMNFFENLMKGILSKL